MKPQGLWRRFVPLVAASALALTVAACSGDDGGSESVAASGEVTGTLRLGYFPNLTHAPALVGVEQGTFAKELGSGVKLAPSTFNSGTQEAEAILSGAIDAGFIGPNPAVNTFIKSRGEAIRIVSGVTSGGAALVVKPEITSVDQLRGKTLATPSLGNTQDVALRYFLKKKGFETDTKGGGDVSIRPQDNSVTVDAFKSGAIDGAWVPEPTASRLVSEGGHVLVDEADEWPETDGKFVTTVLLVRTDYLKKNPEIVERLITANINVINQLNDDPAAGQAAANEALKKLTGKPLADDVVSSAWKGLTFSPDPVAKSLFTSAAHQEELGLIKDPQLDGIFDLSVVNRILADAGEPAVADK
ncbi:NitT/TauT family transport system substrate-binding protein [Parafrankia irregularis]|uniref:NitT/TauT family transport system substrate-binding protein n=1 Tax=Parafrankia irregularis TaxID=795642 RepID=A0A0S4QMJ3_9ACTN|nr:MULTISPECIES: ABC transporter substrate-binding protein [Parafrankia]MBE3205446.1 ABC transporter substrate-binding protein [Parafrankia sp. CH37]CUU55658.1 NitT/TauT family transport system substrate-binding protein [Parafrankia irregularis]